ncbi:MAG: PT domain-containing protein, partial [Candidatus Micrarchaeota archaeon]|nr:PT domain-containing protein [Candidatus Micrarchaeota archaeon]
IRYGYGHGFVLKSASSGQLSLVKFDQNLVTFGEFQIKPTGDVKKDQYDLGGDFYDKTLALAVVSISEGSADLDFISFDPDWNKALATEYATEYQRKYSRGFADTAKPTAEEAYYAIFSPGSCQGEGLQKYANADCVNLKNGAKVAIYWYFPEPYSEVSLAGRLDSRATAFVWGKDVPPAEGQTAVLEFDQPATVTSNGSIVKLKLVNANLSRDGSIELEATSESTATATVNPTATPSAQPTLTPSATPQASVTPTPVPTAEPTQVSGWVAAQYGSSGTSLFRLDAGGGLSSTKSFDCGLAKPAPNQQSVCGGLPYKYYANGSLQWDARDSTAFSDNAVWSDFGLTAVDASSLANSHTLWLAKGSGQTWGILDVDAFGHTVNVNRFESGLEFSQFYGLSDGNAIVVSRVDGVVAEVGAGGSFKKLLDAKQMGFIIDTAQPLGDDLFVLGTAYGDSLLGTAYGEGVPSEPVILRIANYRSLPKVTATLRPGYVDYLGNPVYDSHIGGFAGLAWTMFAVNAHTVIVTEHISNAEYQKNAFYQVDLQDVNFPKVVFEHAFGACSGSNAVCQVERVFPAGVDGVTR